MQTSPRPAPTLAVFDLDGTLTRRDTLLPFLAGYVARHPVKLLRLWRLPGALLAYYAGGRDRGLLKSRVIRMVMRGDAESRIRDWADGFVGTLLPRNRFRPAALAALDAHRRAGDRLVLLSASPDLYVPDIGRLLGFDIVICTEIEWRDGRLDGSLKTENRRGEEKRRCVERLRSQFPGLTVAAYGNSAADLPHLIAVERPMLVNGNFAANRRAERLGIPRGLWP